MWLILRERTKHKVSLQIIKLLESYVFKSCFANISNSNLLTNLNFKLITINIIPVSPPTCSIMHTWSYHSVMCVFGKFQLWKWIFYHRSFRNISLHTQETVCSIDWKGTKYWDSWSWSLIWWTHIRLLVPNFTLENNHRKRLPWPPDMMQLRYI